MTGGGNQQAVPSVPVIDYEGSQYRADFWLGQGRAYEDAVERLALQQLMPAHGGRIAEIGAGFGRLAQLYSGYEQVLLLDYSRTLLQDAAREWGQDRRFVFVAGNIYTLPLVTGALDTLVMVRVMHHLADVPAALFQLRRVLHRHSVAVIEYANKRNLKALLRWGLRRQNWSPLDQTPVEFVKLNFDFHPEWMEAQFRAVGLTVQHRLAVSHFRLAQFKERIAAAQLARIDSLLFAAGGVYPLAPSVFVQASATGALRRPALSTDPADIGALFRCPQCGTQGLALVAEDRMSCPGCAVTYSKKNSVWDLKEPG